MHQPCVLTVALALVLGSSASAQINHALNGTATQSTTAFGGLAARAIDGDTNPTYNQGSITHTDNQMNSWWEVDLGALVSIDEVRVFNRGDCCHTRLSNFRLSIWDGQTEVFGEDYYTTSGSVPAAGQHTVLPPGGVVGDRVRVEFLGNNLDGNGYLSLAEVEVYDSAIGTNYCSPAAFNSTGSSGGITAFGSDVASQNSLSLTAHGLPSGQLAYFLGSMTQGFLAFPGSSQGHFCLAHPTARFNGQVGMVANGSFSIVVDTTNLALPPTFAHTILAGETWNFQCWYQDQNPGPTSNFTDAVAISFL